VRTFRALLVALVALAAAFVGGAAPTQAATTQAATARAYGNDVSWPQCPKSGGVGYGLPMPGKSSQFVVIGLTQGRGFLANPCVKWQVDHAKRRHLYTAAYAFTTYPTSAQFRANAGNGKTVVQKLRNVGYAQARFNVWTMRRAGLKTPMVWIDVEPSKKRPWSKSKVYNAAVVEGAVRGYQKAGLKVGFYSTTYLWTSIVGNLRPGLPEWRTAGSRGKTVALQRCAEPSFQGGRAVLAQWWTSSVDFNVTCPGFGTRTTMRNYFRKY
jgi:hypothetical protein